MNKLFLLIIVPFLFSLSGENGEIQKPNKINKNHVKLLSFSELTQEQKATALEHFKTTGDCEWNGIKLYGKVQFVTSFPDIKIEYTESFPDIKVKFVSSFPDDCGEWQVVESFPDFKVQVVESFSDLKVKKVDSFPGME